MSQYLTADELAELVGCKPGSKACQRRWLDRHKWPYETNLAGFPCVARAYYDQRMLGLAPPVASGPKGPNREALLKRINKNDRQTKAA